VEWRLECVLPDVPSEKLQDYEYDECLTIHPEEINGNGIFIAHFQIKPAECKKVAPMHRINTTLTGLNLTELEEETRGSISKKEKKTGRQKGERLRIRLPKKMRDSVERLSAPRLYVDHERESLFEQARINSNVIQFSERNHTKHFSKKLPAPAATPITGVKEQSNEEFRRSLNNFFSPKNIALKAIDGRSSQANISVFQT
jgi:hypothetical protein